METLPIKILKKYCFSFSKNNFNVLLKHSEDVKKEALFIAKKHPELKIDINFLNEASMLHDIGICALTEDTPYIMHGVLGKKILKKEGLKKHALVCERHVGAGISRKESRKLGLPERDMIPRSIEEKIICYADKMYSKSKKGKHRIASVRKELAKYGKDQLKRFEELHKLLS